MSAKQYVDLTYKNHRGQVRKYTLIVKPLLWFGPTDYYPEPGWNMDALVLMGDGTHARTFRMDNVISWGPA